MKPILLLFLLPLIAAAQITTYPNASASGNATTVNGGSVPASQPCVGTNSSSQLIAGTCGTPTLTNTHFFVGNASNVATDVAMSKDATVSNAGAVTVIGLNGTLLSGLGTGFLKNTTGTGVPSIAGFSDFLGITTGTPTANTLLGGDGVWKTVSSGFDAITSATNTTATMTVGTGASLTTSGSGTINANRINGSTAATSATTDATNAANISSGTLANARLGVPFTFSGSILGIGPTAFTPTGTFGVLDATATTGGTFIWMGADGSGTYSGTHLSATSTQLNLVTGTAQGSTTPLLRLLSADGVYAPGFRWDTTDNIRLTKTDGTNTGGLVANTVYFNGFNSNTAVGASALSLDFNSTVRWHSTVSTGSAIDIGMQRDAAGVVSIENGTQGTTVANYRDVKARHVLGAGTVPTITSGFGTSPSIAGPDEVFNVTIGTGGVATTGVITFGTAYTGTAVACSANDNTTLLTTRTTPTLTTVTLTSATPWSAGDVIGVLCRGF